MLYILVVTTIISFSTIKLLSKSLHFNDMNKAISFLIIVTMIVSVMGMISADTTVVAGTVYELNSNPIKVVGEADILVSCNEVDKTATSLDDGSYSVIFTSDDFTDEENFCDYGDILTISATKGDLSGSTEGPIQYDNVDTFSLDVGIYNVPLVPEFGAIVASLTVLGALGVFFVVRKK
jgi:hypothetical protein